MMRVIKYSAATFASLLLLICAALVVAPWKEYAAPLLTAQLKKHGLPVATLRIAQVGRDGITLAPLVLQMTPPLTLPEVTVGWQLQGFAPPTPYSLTLRGMRYDLGQATRSTPPGAPPPAIPVDPAFFAQIPLAEIRMKDMELVSTQKVLGFVFPFAARLSLTPAPVLTAESQEVMLRSGEHTIHLADLRLALTLEPERQAWSGTLTVRTITHQAEEPLFPPLTLTAPVTLQPTRLHAQITLTSSQGTYTASLQHRLDKGTTRISDVTLPLAGGQVTVTPFTLGKNGAAPITTTVTLKGVGLAPLLALLMDAADVRAEGTLDGSIPITLQNGGVKLGAGALKAREAGVLALSGDSVRALGSEGQAANVAQLLGDFRYSLLMLSLDPAGEEVMVRLRLEGSNPAVYDGKRVHLNITVSGDVMKSLKSTLRLLDGSGEWLKEELQ